MSRQMSLLEPRKQAQVKQEARPMPDRQYWDARLHEMLRWRRPHGSSSEVAWVERFITTKYDSFPIEDKSGDVLAHVVIIHTPNGESPTTLFSSHTDTVHRVEGRQKITFNLATNHYGKNDGEPLGADCAAGVWLMLEMIDRKVPGAYFFHRGEECGGIGSDGIAMEYERVLERFQRAVAFDRKGTWSVITHQWRGRCCSDAFGQALADQINLHNDDFMYATDDTGIFTDTANYREIIPECTNISVGYYDEHTSQERLDLEHLFALRDTLVKVDWENLPTHRDPSVRDPEDYPTVTFTTDDWSKWKQQHNDAVWKDDEADLRSYRLNEMTRSEMENLAYDDVGLFVDLVRYELHNEVPRWAKERVSNGLDSDDRW